METGKLRAFMDLSRIHGSPIIIGFCLLGMLSAAGTPSILDFLPIIIIGFIFKSAGSVHNELVDLDADSRDPMLQKKPIQAGLISKREARIYMLCSLAAGAAMSILFFPPAVSGLLFLAVGVIFIYNAWGKYVPVLYELLFSTSMTLLLLAGALLAGGPTRLTAVLALTVFTSSIFAQWLNGCRDLDCDKNAGVASIPSLQARCSGHDDINVLTGVVIWVLYTFSLLLPFIFCVIRLVYLPLTLGIHAGTSISLFRGLHRAATRSMFNRLLVFQVVAYWFMVPIFLVEKAGWAASLGLSAFTILGTILAIAAEKATQYKLAFDPAGPSDPRNQAAGGVDG